MIPLAIMAGKALAGAAGKAAGKAAGGAASAAKTGKMAAAKKFGKDLWNKEVPNQSKQSHFAGDWTGGPKQSVPSFKHGGRVKKTGLALVHKGEYVVPVKQARGKARRHKRAIVKA